MFISNFDVAVVDFSGKVPDGVFLNEIDIGGGVKVPIGNHAALGDYQHCIEIDEVANVSGSKQLFQGRYSVLAIGAVANDHLGGEFAPTSPVSNRLEVELLKHRLEMEELQRLLNDWKVLASPGVSPYSISLQFSKNFTIGLKFMPTTRVSHDFDSCHLTLISDQHLVDNFS